MSICVCPHALVVFVYVWLLRHERLQLRFMHPALIVSSEEDLPKTLEDLGWPNRVKLLATIHTDAEIEASIQQVQQVHKLHKLQQLTTVSRHWEGLYYSSNHFMAVIIVTTSSSSLYSCSLSLNCVCMCMSVCVCLCIL